VRRSVRVLHLHRDDWRVTRGDLARHLRLGLPMGFQASIIAIGALAVQVRLNSLGADAVAAYTTATRVDKLAVALLASLGLAVSTFVAQNHGAGRPDRIRLGVIQAAGIDPRPQCVVGQVGFGSLPRVMREKADPEQMEHLRQMLAADAAQRVQTGVSTLIDPGMVLNDEQSVVAFGAGLKALPQLATQLPLEALDRIMEYEPERVVTQIAPRALLLIGARHDTAAPVSELRHLYAAARQPKRLEILDIGHYEIYDLPHRTTAINLALEWFRTYLRLGQSQ